MRRNCCLFVCCFVLVIVPALHAWSILLGDPNIGVGLGEKIAANKHVFAVAYETGNAVAFFRVPKADDNVGNILPLGTIRTPCDCDSITMNDDWFLCTCGTELHVFEKEKNDAATDEPVRVLDLGGYASKESIDIHRNTAIVGLRHPHGAVIFNDLRRDDGGKRKLAVHENSTADGFAMSVSTYDGYAVVPDPHMRRNGAKVRGIEFAGSAFTYCRNRDGNTKWGECRDRLPGELYRTYLGLKVRMGSDVAIFKNQHNVEAYGRNPLSGPWKYFFEAPAAPHDDMDFRDGKLLITHGVFSSDGTGRLRLYDRGPAPEWVLDTAGRKIAALGHFHPSADVELLDVGNTQFGRHGIICGDYVVVTAPGYYHNHDKMGAVYVFSVHELERNRELSLGLAPHDDDIEVAYQESRLQKVRRLAKHVTLKMIKPLWPPKDIPSVMALCGFLLAFGGSIYIVALRLTRGQKNIFPSPPSNEKKLD